MHKNMQTSAGRDLESALGFGDILQQAERGYVEGDRAAIFKAVRKLAPKMIKKTWQLRKQGKILSPYEEVQLVREY